MGYLKVLLLSLALFSVALGQESLDIGVPVGPTGFDPGMALNTPELRVNFNVFDTLIRRDFLGGDNGDGQELVPSLAESWERASDTVLEVKLRDGVTFHNGEPLTAEDVKFSFDRLLAPDSEYVRAQGYFDTIQSIEVIDPLTVRFETAAPDPVLERRLASKGAHIVPMDYFQEVGAEGFNFEPVGSGPYRVTEYRPDERVVLEAYENFWGEVPSVTTLTYRVIPEVSARITALINGEVDLITDVPPDQYETVDGAECCEVRSVTRANIQVLVYNAEHPVLDDKRLRQAMSMAIDRQLLVDTLWQGLTVVPNGLQLPEFGELYVSNHPKPAYDPERARQLIETSDYDGAPIELQLRPNFYPNDVQVAEAVVEMWRQVGLNAQVTLDPNVFDLPADEQMVLLGSSSGEWGDPTGLIWRSYGPDNFSQERGLWIPEDVAFNRLGQEAEQTLDTAARARNYQRMLKILEDEVPVTVLYQTVDAFGVREGVNWQPYNDLLMDFRPYNLSLE